MVIKFARSPFFWIAILALISGAFIFLSPLWKPDSSLADKLTYSLIEQIQYEPSFPAPVSLAEGSGLLAVSEGVVEVVKIKDYRTGEILGEASVLRTSIKGLGDETSSLSFIVQLVPSGRNIIAWLAEKAGQLRQLEVSTDDPLEASEIADIFPRGSTWLFVPLVDTSEDYLKNIPENTFYAQRYYGSAAAADFRDYLDSGLSGSYARPIFALDVIYYGGNILDKD